MKLKAAVSFFSDIVMFEAINDTEALMQDTDICCLSNITFKDFVIEMQSYDFPVKPEKSEFPKSRLTKSKAIKCKIKKVTKPSPPSYLEKASVIERLRWILSPPIHLILSDTEMCLPFSPYPFQSIGIKWLYDRPNALLADEMGLGKTMQAIIAARLLWKEGVVDQILIICPKSLISNWKEEIKKWWAGSGNYIHETTDDRKWFLRMGSRFAIFKIINYEAIQRELEWLKDQRFSHDLIIIDEAQRIKNPGSKTARAVKALKGPRRWALTGTPLENKIEDVVSIFGFVHSKLTHNMLDPYTIKNEIKPYLLRRLTKEVLKDLPKKIEYDVPIQLNNKHLKHYKTLERDRVIELQKGKSITVAHIFALIARLRQVCNFDPATGLSAKAERLLEDIEEIVENKQKVLVFSQFVSEKFGLMRISKELKRKGYHTVELHGKIPPKKRDSIIDKFRNDSKSDVLLLNYAVGGVGLNLQVANHVFLFDRWWNPAVEDQAIKRAHRLGQKNKVFVHRFFCQDTIEERIIKKLAEKRRLFNEIINEGRPDPDSFGLSEKELFSLFDIEVHKRSSETDNE
ncbi:MAG: DEAD/DEAH box helicase [Candidatus Marinimicrobia bacterium]|nr:DEAD/DEAH box helicase [Candidatus Neomarinimicrobiota bacterium]